jgi:hypothetical protein
MIHAPKLMIKLLLINCLVEKHQNWIWNKLLGVWWLSTQTWYYLLRHYWWTFFTNLQKKDLMYQIQCRVYYLVMSTIDWLCRRRGGPKWKFCLELLWYMPLWQTSSLWSIPNRWSFLKWWVLILVFIYQWIVKIQRRETCQREAQQQGSNYGREVIAC